MMKPFQQYFFESNKLFEFRVKIANSDITPDLIERIKNAIDVYQVETISKPKRLPIQEHRDFGKLGPCECSLIDIAVKYPTIVKQIRQLIINRAGVSAAHICVYTKNQALQEDEVESTIVGQGEDGPIIENPELKDEPGAQDLVGQVRIGSLLKELQTRKYEVAAEDTNADKVFEPGAKKGNTLNNVPQGNIDPVGSIKKQMPDPTKRKG